MFKQRSFQKELLDEEHIPKDLLWQNLRELEFINTYLGGHKITINALDQLQPLLKQKSTLRIADIGCGGGDSLNALQYWLNSKKITAQLIGIDLKADCIEFAAENCKHLNNVQWVCDDFRNAFNKHEKIDVVHASLFCHHFTESDIVSFIKICKAHGAIFIINDLERHPIAYYAIQFLTKLFSRSPLVKHDAPLSVLRGFKKLEWKAMLLAAQVHNYSLKNKWAFRHQLIIYPQ